MTSHVFLSLFLMLGQTPAASVAQAVPAAGTATQTPASAAADGGAQADRRAAPDTYQIGPNDTLDISVFGEPELTNKYHVDESGAVTFPMIGRVIAGGKKIAQFQE